MSTKSPTPISGPQYDISCGTYTASIAGVGATLRTLAHDGRDLIVPFGADDVRPGFRGAVLVPWPNRVVDGQYYFNGHNYSLAVTEPERGHSLHGLAMWATWDLAEQSEARVRLTHTIAPQSGYPFRLTINVTYTLTEQGLTWEVSATNTGHGIAPYGTGPHPYLIPGEGTIDDWTVHIPACEVLAVTPDRLIPIDVHDVETYDGGTLDFRTTRTVGDTFIDHAYTGIDFSEEGTATVDIFAPSGTGVRMTWDTSCPWLQVHTPEGPGADTWRTGLAVEPMTCPPDAFNSGTDLVKLDVGENHTTRWIISAL